MIGIDPRDPAYEEPEERGEPVDTGYEPWSDENGPWSYWPERDDI